jgi:RNA polymerase sigma-70 factor, ECF subfamily
VDIAVDEGFRETDETGRGGSAATFQPTVMPEPALTFAELYERHYADVHRFAYWVSGNPHDAADLASEAFVRAWSSLDAPRTDTVKAYLMAIVRNLHRNHWRRASRHEAVDEEMPDPSASPDVQADLGDRVATVRRLLAGLSELDRSLVLMRAEEGLSYEDIAAATGLSAAAAKLRVFRARAKLALEWEGTQETP